MDTAEQVEPPLPEQQQPVPGTLAAMDPRPDHGEESYRGSGRLEDNPRRRRQRHRPRRREVRDFGKSYPIGRPAQPKELAPVYVMLASDEASYVSGATVAVTGGQPFV